MLAVIQSQVGIALDLELALSSISDMSWESREIERLEAKMKRQEEVIEHNKQMKAMIYDDFKSEVIGLEEYNIFKAEFDKNIREAKQAITRLQGNRNKVSAGLTEQQGFLAQFKKYENIQELNRRIVVNFVERIEISAEKEICVFLNHADQFQAIQEYLCEYHGRESIPETLTYPAKEVG